MKSYKVIADIAEYNSYKMEVFASDIAKANEIIMKYNKDVINKNVILTLFEPSVEYCVQQSPRCTNITFLSVEYFENDVVIKKSLASKEIMNFNQDTIKFNYIIKIAEYNRYSITMKDVVSQDQITHILRSNENIKINYQSSLIDIGVKPKLIGDENIITLDISELS